MQHDWYRDEKIRNAAIFAVFFVGVAWFATGTPLLFGEKMFQEYPGPEEFQKLRVLEQRTVIEEIAKKNPQHAWEYLKSVAQREGRTVVNAHGYGHIIGKALYTQYGFSGITRCSNDFGYACMHGVTEIILEQKGPEAIADIEKTCRDTFESENQGGNLSQLVTGCPHGAGHGLLTYYAYDVAKALTACKGFSTQMNRYCFMGVFMEASQEDPGTIREVLEADPWSFCRNVPEEALEACSQYVPVALTTQTSTDGPFLQEGAQMLSLVDDCNAAPTQKSGETCIQTVGHILTQSYHENPAKVLEMCDAVQEPSRSICLDAAATEFAFQRYLEMPEAISLLCSAISSEEKKSLCTAQAQKTYEREVSP